MAFGEESPVGEIPVSWQTFSDGGGGVPTIDGDQSWGKMLLVSSQEGRSAVYDFGNSDARTYTLIENKYGSGSGTATLQIRGSLTSYTDPINREWRYIQIRETE